MRDAQLPGVERGFVDDVLLERVDGLRQDRNRLSAMPLAHQPDAIEGARKGQDLGIVQTVPDLERFVDHHLLVAGVAQKFHHRVGSRFAGIDQAQEAIVPEALRPRPGIGDDLEILLLAIGRVGGGPVDRDLDQQALALRCLWDVVEERRRTI